MTLYFSLVIAFAHLILGFIVLFSIKEHKKANIFLAIQLFALFIIYINCILGENKIYFLRYILWTGFAFTCGYGASVFHYVRTYLNDKLKFDFLFVLSYIPSLICLVLFVKYISLPETQITPILNSIFAFNHFWYNVFFNYISSAIVIILMGCSVLYFISYTKKKRWKLNEQEKWMKLYLSSMAIMAFLVMPISLIYRGAYDSKIIPMLTLPFYLIFTQKAFYFSRTSKNIGILNNSANEEDHKNLVKTIERYMVLNKPYLDKTLTLQMLAQKLNMNEKQISHTLNIMYGEYFTDYVNRHRVEESKQRLVDENFKNNKIDTLALESGFNSRTTFYEAFKKHAGCTPSQFRKQNIN